MRLRKIFPFDEFEHEGPRRADLLEAVHLRNVRVIERGERFRFTLEAGEALRVVDERLREDLERHVAAQPRVAGAIHLAHAPDAEEREDLVMTERGDRSQAHPCR